MEAQRSAALLEHFGELAAPRIERHKEHKRIDILGSAICALLWGANDWVAGETVGKAKRAGCTRFLDLAHGLPAHATFGRVFARLAPEALPACFLGWLPAVAPVSDGQGMASDGQPLRRSYARRAAKAALPRVSAWATQNRVVLGHLKTEEKSNEIPASPELLNVLDVRGGSVTREARGCQKAKAAQMVAQAAA